MITLIEADGKTLLYKRVNGHQLRRCADFCEGRGRRLQTAVAVSKIISD
jgi:hypothetical protein